MSAGLIDTTMMH